MGMYTELVISTVLDAPDEVIAVLQYMIGEQDKPAVLPAHPLFESERWPIMLRCTSYYHVPRTAHVLERDSISKDWAFINRSDFKDYDAESELFFDWINPYCQREEGEMLGYTRYEEDREPTIFYKKAAGERAEVTK